MTTQRFYVLRHHEIKTYIGQRPAAGNRLTSKVDDVNDAYRYPSTTAAEADRALIQVGIAWKVVPVDFTNGVATEAAS